MKISLIIPYYEVDDTKKAILKRCLDSMKDQYDEVILVVQPKGAGIGFSKAVNKGYELATGDYLIMCSDDVILKKGTLKQLCDPESVVSAHIEEQVVQDFWGTLWCTPRWVYEKVGGLFEGYRISYFDDDDYINTLKQAGIPMHSVPTVNVQHPEGGRTLHTFPDHDEFFAGNQELFKKRWNL